MSALPVSAPAQHLAAREGMPTPAVVPDRPAVVVPLPTTTLAPTLAAAPALASPPPPGPAADVFMPLARRRGYVLAGQFPRHAPRQQMATELRLFSNALLSLAVARAIRDNPQALPDVETVALLAQRFVHPDRIRQWLAPLRPAGRAGSAPDWLPSLNEEGIRQVLYAAPDRERFAVLSDFAAHTLPLIARAAPRLPLDIVIPEQASAGYYAPDRGGLVLVDTPVRFTVEADIPVNATLEIDNRVIPVSADTAQRLRQRTGSTVTLAAFARLTGMDPTTWISGDLLGVPLYALEQVGGFRLDLTLKWVSSYADPDLTDPIAELPLTRMEEESGEPGGPSPQALLTLRLAGEPLIRLGGTGIKPDPAPLSVEKAPPPEPAASIEAMAAADSPAMSPANITGTLPAGRQRRHYDIAGLSLDMTPAAAEQILRRGRLTQRLSFSPYRLSPALGFDQARLFMSADNRETVALVADPDRPDGRLLAIGRYVVAAEPYVREELVRAMLTKYGEPRAVNGPFLVWGGQPGRGDVHGPCFMRLDQPARGRWADADGTPPNWPDLTPSRTLQGFPGPRAMPWPSFPTVDAESTDIRACGPTVAAWVPLTPGARDYAVWLTDVSAFPGPVGRVQSGSAAPQRPRL
ncbi:hypothetical protein [Ancylobacter lacus]|uniref:hypothetical protein n=1 Tax=Ancylobacter lacus TaxID=2579970 RepID=UPI001BD1478A|nr:hypothetical protein [Ancylobacter lacus]MBS7537794.1 hypothetical protein [Ancylobacter lacus]